MMKNPHPAKRRVMILLGVFGAFLLLFGAVLYDAQILHGSENRARSISSNATSEVVPASRGIITDRNGKVLVSNRLAYTLVFDRSGFTDDASLNDAILRLIRLCQETGTAWNDTLPIAQTGSFLRCTNDRSESFTQYLEKNKLTATAAGRQLIAEMRALYHVDESLSEKDARLVIGVRYELHSRDSYTFAEDVSSEVLSLITDGRYEGVSIRTASARVYNTTLAAHILGTIGPIWQEEWSSNEKTGYVGYADKGYSMNDLVGKDGVEKAFEEYLRGTDGRRLITTDEDGKLTGELYTREPQPGGTVALTLDIDLQADVERALAQTITGMIDEDSNERGGAAAVVSVGSGEALALASYPTYDLSTFNEDYEDLVADERLPMFNRATQGTYAPGSTFKLCTSVAALESGVITPSSTIVDRGIYTYYEFPQPRCWIYNATGGTHGAVNVSQAITVSCNYFFYEVGRLTGIQRLDDYASQFGLGRSTGIEIGDSDGVLASPEYAEKIGETWTDGQTITAAIGQSYNLFTPLQLANYVATLVSGGDHYEAHLLKSAKSYDNSSVVYAYNKGPTNHVDMSDSTLEAVKTGARGLATGSLSYVFNSCIVPVGCKTGTAETGGELSNGCFVAFAPYDDPQIAVCVVIEQGGGGANLAPIARDIINSYFSSASTSATVVGENTLLP